MVGIYHPPMKPSHHSPVNFATAERFASMTRVRKSGDRPPGMPRSRPLKGEEAEVKHVVETHDLSPDQARELLRRHGNDWRKIDEAAKSYKDEK
ncbi:hypothetical protein RFN31_21580 [Mesorhizobium sp. VK3C]|nr:hypothetical protein [Mesorhizobium sp. VK3C]